MLMAKVRATVINFCLVLRAARSTGARGLEKHSTRRGRDNFRFVLHARWFARSLARSARGRTTGGTSAIFPSRGSLAYLARRSVASERTNERYER